MRDTSEPLALVSKAEAAIFERGLISAGDRVCVAVSGGRDSMALLHLLCALRDKLSFALTAVNIEHGIRGEASKHDSQFTAEQCCRLGIKLFSFAADVPAAAAAQKTGIEETARRVRHTFFASLAGQVDKVALAHHADDNAETVLLHLLRGSGANGLRGMNYTFKLRQNITFIRPFLDVSGGEIEEYTSRCGIEYIEDESNADTSYDRNFLRHIILAPIKERWGGAAAQIAAAATKIRADDDCLHSFVPDALINDGQAQIPLDSFALPPPLLSRLIFKSLAGIGITCGIEDSHIALITSLGLQGESGSRLDLPHGLYAYKDYACVTLTRGECAIRYSVTVTPVAADAAHTQGANAAGARVLYCDGGKLGDDYEIRTRREGDTFTKFGGGTKKLKDYLIDIKVPQRKRDSIPLICRGGEVLVVCGFEISDSVRITDGTQRAVKIEITGGGK